MNLPCWKLETETVLWKTDGVEQTRCRGRCSLRNLCRTRWTCYCWCHRRMPSSRPSSSGWTRPCETCSPPSTRTLWKQTVLVVCNNSFKETLSLLSCEVIIYSQVYFIIKTMWTTQKKVFYKNKITTKIIFDQTVDAFTNRVRLARFWTTFATRVNVRVVLASGISCAKSNSIGLRIAGQRRRRKSEAVTRRKEMRDLSLSGSSLARRCFQIENTSLNSTGK